MLNAAVIPLMSAVSAVLTDTAAVEHDGWVQACAVLGVAELVDGAAESDPAVGAFVTDTGMVTVVVVSATDGVPGSLAVMVLVELAHPLRAHAVAVTRTTSPKPLLVARKALWIGGLIERTRLALAPSLSLEAAVCRAIRGWTTATVAACGGAGA